MRRLAPVSRWKLAWRGTGLSRAQDSLRRHAGTAQPEMPENLRKVMAEYERRRAKEESQKDWTAKLQSSTMGGLLGAGVAGVGMYLCYCLDDVSSELHSFWGVLFRLLGPEGARTLLLRSARWRLLPKDLDKDDPYLVTEPQEGLTFFTPVGLAPGLDNEGVGLGAFFNLGFGFVDIGPVLGGDSEKGLEVWKNINARDPGREVTQFGLTGVCVGGNKEELLGHLSALGPKVQLFTVDLAAVPEELSRGAALSKLTRELTIAASEVPGGGPRILLRLPAQPAGPEARSLIGDVAEAALSGTATGLVLCHCDEGGDFGGSEASRRSLKEQLSEAFLRTKGELMLVASGGIRNGRDAMDAVEAGATVVQISSLMLTEGPRSCRRIKTEMAQILMHEGHTNLQSVVGSGVRKSKPKGKKRNPWKAKSA